MIDRTLYPGFPAEDVARYRERGYWGTRTIGEELHQVALAHPDVEAVVDLWGRVSYRELDERSDAIAARLHEIGLRKGDTVLLQIGNTIESVEAFYGLIKMGAVPVCSLVLFGHHEIDAIAEVVGARAHLIQADVPIKDLVEFAGEVRKACPSVEFTLTVRGDAPGGHRLDDAPAAAPADYGVDDPDAIAVMQLSGGTTGTPKAIPRLHAEYWYNGRATAERFGYQPGSRLAHFLPFVHNAGLHLSLFPGHASGATVVLAPTWIPDLVMDILEKEKIEYTGTLTSLVPSILEHPKFADATRYLKRFGVAIPAIPGEMFDDLESRGIAVTQFYGMSEGFGSSMASDAGREMRRETVGYAYSPHDELMLIDPETAEPVDGDVGELCVRGPYTLRGYYNAAEHNERAFTPDGFLRTGDMVRLVDIDGKRCLQIQGRHKDLISRGGEKINAEEIETLLVEMPYVAQAALVAMPDPRLGERACAVLVMADGVVPRLEDICDFLEKRDVAKYKWPERVEFLDELPTTPVGKIAKATLRDMVAVRLEAEKQAENEEA
jgi:non-ribosomal peptide synthetase component E (peptide arylation enzyme)